MWNVFDTAFIVVFVTYLGLRVHGLTTHNGPSLTKQLLCMSLIVRQRRRQNWDSISWRAGLAYCFLGLSRSLTPPLSILTVGKACILCYHE